MTGHQRRAAIIAVCLLSHELKLDIFELAYQKYNGCEGKGVTCHDVSNSKSVECARMCAFHGP